MTAKSAVVLQLTQFQRLLQGIHCHTLKRNFTSKSNRFLAQKT